MAASTIKTVGVVGTGVIGSSWTALFLAHGLRVLVSDPAQGAEEKLHASLNLFWPSLEKLGLAPFASLANCTFVGASLAEHYGEVDFVQENAPEKAELKRKIIAEIDAGTRPEVVISSSSSGLPSSQFIQDCKKNPSRVLIGHPFNPPHLMPLVEVVPHPGVDKSYAQQAMDFYTRLGRKPILLSQEIPGFVANRLQAALCNEAYSLVRRGVVTAEGLDACVTAGPGLRWALNGPFMTNVLGGGGGKDGFKHILGHIGPAANVWLKDMAANAYEYTPENLDELDASVQHMLSKYNPATVEEERDEVLMEMLKMKSKCSALV